MADGEPHGDPFERESPEDETVDRCLERLEREGVGKIDEDIEALRALGILVDGAGKGLYMLQIFLEDGATLYGEKAAGPFFLELIQRKGDELFGGGNFRALFESIEDQQRQQRRV